MFVPSCLMSLVFINVHTRVHPVHVRKRESIEWAGLCDCINIICKKHNLRTCKEEAFSVKAASSTECRSIRYSCIYHRCEWRIRLTSATTWKHKSAWGWSDCTFCKSDTSWVDVIHSLNTLIHFLNKRYYNSCNALDPDLTAARLNLVEFKQLKSLTCDNGCPSDDSHCIDWPAVTRASCHTHGFWHLHVLTATCTCTGAHNPGYGLLTCMIQKILLS